MLVCATLLVSCKKENIETIVSNTSSTNATNSQSMTAIDLEQSTQIGEKLANPFTVENMEKAYDALSRNKAAVTITPNMYYVRFLPKTSEELQVLINQGLNLSQTPLDVKVNQYGSTIQSSAIASTEPVWVYTTVKPDYKFGTIKYEIIDKLFLPALEENVKSVDQLFTEFSPEDLENKSLELQGFEVEKTTKRASAKYRAKGYIRYQDVVGNTVTNVGVKKIKVQSRWWFYYGSGTTDANGYFECNETYSSKRDVEVKVFFENDLVNVRTIKGYNIVDMLFTERQEIGTYSGNNLQNINYIFYNAENVESNSKRYWMACHALNAVYEHRQYCVQSGIGSPPSNLNLWLTGQNKKGKNISTAAAAPMLKQMANSSLLVGATQVYLGLVGSPITAVAIQVLKQELPDITYAYNGEGAQVSQYSDQIYQVIYHELSHACHYAKVRNAFWTPYITYIIQHNGYGQKSDSGSGRIALSESWAEFFSEYIAGKKYGKNTSYGKYSFEDLLESFTVADVNSTWIPVGVMYDLLDPANEPSYTNIKDNVGGYTISQFYYVMDNSVTSEEGFRDKFILTFGLPNKTKIIDLFKSYGY